ncbi:MAG: pantoate--beta-alanine ligase [Edaphobacter sp.]
MKIIETVAEMQHLCRNLRTDHAPLGLVPTMGALHAGHLSLVRRAQSECASVAATIFVNPLQFGPTEDLAKYPRTFDEDCRQLAAAGVSLLFAPTPAEMYPAGAATTISVSGIGDRLDGASRPGHFTGVATVVAKLFHIAQPHRAYFGQKDAAQLAVLRQMARDLNFDLEIVGCPIVRDADGLALSSRNKYLSPSERTEALALHRTLAQMQQSIASGERQSEALIKGGIEKLSKVKLDYLVAVDAQTLLPVSTVQPGTLIAVAAWVGQTRLIDNFLVD